MYFLLAYLECLGFDKDVLINLNTHRIILFHSLQTSSSCFCFRINVFSLGKPSSKDKLEKNLAIFKTLEIS